MNRPGNYRVRQQPRTQQHAQLFWYNMPVGFTSTLDEQVTASTETEGWGGIVRGAWSDLALARVRFVLGASKEEFESEQVAILSQIGNSDKAQPLRPWNPFLIQPKSTIQGQFINSGAEAAGRVCWAAEIAGREGTVRVKSSKTFWLRADLGQTSGQILTQPNDWDLLVYGASTNSAVTIEGRVFNQSTNVSWSSDNIPIRAMAGLSTSVQPIMRYHTPYLLPKYVQLRVDVNTHVTGDYMEFLCEQILDPVEQASY